MGLLTYITRGNDIEFVASFADSEGGVVTPSSVSLRVSYLNAAGNRTTETLAMGEQDTSGATWVANWDSSVAKKGRVHWSVRSLNPGSAEDGQFELQANLGNADPA